MILEEVNVITENELELIKITLRYLDKISKFDTLRIYQSSNFFELHTVCHSEKYITRTKISKCTWKITECILHRAGELEVKLK